MRVGYFLFAFPFPLFFFFLFFFFLFFLHLFHIRSILQKVSRGGLFVCFAFGHEFSEWIYRLVFSPSFTHTLYSIFWTNGLDALTVIYGMIYDLSYNEDHHPCSTGQ